MGFWHDWKLSKKYDDRQWEGIKGDAEILFKALPVVAKQRVVRDMKSGFWGMVSGAAVLLSDRKHPVRRKYDGSLFGVDENGAPSIGFLPYSDNLAGAFEIEVPNSAQARSAKTGAQLYDHLLVGVLCLCEEKKAGNVKVKSTDGESQYWEHIADWASKVLGRELPMPRRSMDRLQGAPASRLWNCPRFWLITESRRRAKGFEARAGKSSESVGSSWIGSDQIHAGCKAMLGLGVCDAGQLGGDIMRHARGLFAQAKLDEGQ